MTSTARQHIARRAEGPCDTPDCDPRNRPDNPFARCCTCGWHEREHTEELRALILTAIDESPDYVNELTLIEQLVRGGQLTTEHYAGLGERDG